VGGGERRVGRRPGPKTLGKTVDNGLDKIWIGMVAQQPVKDGNVDRSDDPEEVRMRGQSRDSRRKKLRERWSG
jgi:hypothetical protein